MDSSISEVEFLRIISIFLKISVLEKSSSLLEVLEKALNLTQSCLYEPCIGHVTRKPVFVTRQKSTPPAQLQGLARILKLCIFQV